MRSLVTCLSYLETLVEVLEDGQVTEEEQAALAEIAELYELSEQDTASAHLALVRTLAHEALEDGVLARAEKAELTHIAALLAVPPGAVKDLLDGAEETRLETLSAGLHPLPAGWALGEPLRVGHRVVFTGCDPVERDSLETRATRAGVRLTGTVSRRTHILVTDGSVTGTKAAAAAQLGTRQVHPHDFATLLEHLQPWQPATSATPPAPTNPGAPLPPPSNATSHDPDQPTRTHAPTSAARGVSPSAVRVWAREQGHDVGVRGRLSAEVWDAYSAAHE